MASWFAFKQAQFRPFRRHTVFCAKTIGQFVGCLFKRVVVFIIADRKYIYIRPVSQWAKPSQDKAGQDTMRRGRSRRSPASRAREHASCVYCKASIPLVLASFKLYSIIMIAIVCVCVWCRELAVFLFSIFSLTHSLAHKSEAKVSPEAKV